MLDNGSNRIMNMVNKKTRKQINHNWRKRAVTDAGGQSDVIGDYLLITCDYKLLVICVAQSVN